ncbi:YggS family pyridoxal phosphate-dependent enzyme [Blochmannia endosymbiont of Colobopsis nipponica]|uniref:YggS family pyridoxal phosphate-dependent enzyme n=1 Tax=Blochmannia endosymbiont of Colobopsis nipponica TaxID=2681987 RepID=UPI0017871756|nr:YggS family pyridoxal phosphate-dependent enzyme [Blochmannia endosymbiont of Colobopsis nipponica]QOI11178.1 YggS family pyridoxal phosphate-dependent enzyme [Blochmannia endosymbiont of Colobopsis nipponica]
MYNDIKNNIWHVKQEINTIQKQHNKLQKKISFVAVSKNQSIDTINNVLSTGQREFGENYVQESIKKILWFKNNKKIYPKPIWHFIGHIQSNKIKLIAEYFDWCHTITNKNTAFYLNKLRKEDAAPLNILIQININQAKNKSGIYPDELVNLSEKILIYSRLKLRGLMAIPTRESDYYKQLKVFLNMNKLFKQLQNIYPSIDTLSIGMSNDMTAAIAAGGNLLRIGTAIFGNRTKNKNLKILNNGI